MPESEYFPISDKKLKELTAALQWHVRQVFSPETWLTDFLRRLITRVEEDGYAQVAANPEMVKELFTDAYHELALAAYSALEVTKLYPRLLDREEWINLTMEENSEHMRQWRAAGSPTGKTPNTEATGSEGGHA